MVVGVLGVIRYTLNQSREMLILNKLLHHIKHNIITADILSIQMVMVGMDHGQVRGVNIIVNIILKEVGQTQNYPSGTLSGQVENSLIVTERLEIHGIMRTLVL